MKKEDIQRRREVSAAFKAWKVKGKMSAGEIQTFSSENVQVRVAMVSGGVFNKDGSDYHFKDQISAATDFVDKWNKSEIEVLPAAISFSLQSYWPHLHEHPKTHQLLLPKKGYVTKTDNSVYGVPPGTVIAWLPSSRDWIFNPVTSSDELRIPEGWELLNSTMSFEDADGTASPNFFLMGAKADSGEIGTFAGTRQHAHKGTALNKQPATTGVDKDSDKQVTHGAHSHSVTVKPTDHTPPSLKVLWIRKL